MPVITSTAQGCIATQLYLLHTQLYLKHTCNHANGLSDLLDAVQLVLLNHIASLYVLVLVVDVLRGCKASCRATEAGASAHADTWHVVISHATKAGSGCIA
jgi:hypothetical protein